jgi:hypothetical protein
VVEWWAAGRTLGVAASRVEVAVTASAFEHERPGFLVARFDAFVDKPVLVGQIYACLAHL